MSRAQKHVKGEGTVNSHREPLPAAGTLTSRQAMQVKPGEMSPRRRRRRRCFLSAEAFSTALGWHSQGRRGSSDHGEQRAAETWWRTVEREARGMMRGWQRGDFSLGTKSFLLIFSFFLNI